MHVLTLIGCVLFSDVGLGDGGGEEARMEEAGSAAEMCVCARERECARVCVFVCVWPR